MTAGDGWWTNQRPTFRQTIKERAQARFLSVRPLLYISVILFAVGAGSTYAFFNDGIFACQADGYAPDRFIADCSAPAYGDYEHGAFWLGLEPTAIDAASHAEVLFLGDSRVQVGFATHATDSFFTEAAAHYYLLGFERNSNVAFVEKLLDKIEPEAKAYIVNLDFFFERQETPLAKFVMQDQDAQSQYEHKRIWQRIHRLSCQKFPSLCGSNYVVFRSRDTGAYDIRGNHDFGGHLYHSGPIRYIHDVVEQDKAARYIASGKEFIQHASVSRPCILATIVPNPLTNIDRARTVATALGLNFVAPELPGLRTFDGSHLDHTSAERWTSAFFAAAGPQLQKCLHMSGQDARPGKEEASPTTEARGPATGLRRVAGAQRAPSP